MSDIEKDVLLHFKQDKPVKSLYDELGSYEKSRLQAVFQALRELEYLAKTNARSTLAATYRITAKGRRWMRSEYGIELPFEEIDCAG